MSDKYSSSKYSSDESPSTDYNESDPYEGYQYQSYSAPHMSTMKVKHVHSNPGYVPPLPKMSKCAPIVCDPHYVIHDCYIPREVPIIQPVIHVQRRVIVNVPKHYVQPIVKQEVVDPGCPTGYTRKKRNINN